MASGTRSKKPKNAPLLLSELKGRGSGFKMIGIENPTDEMREQVLKLVALYKETGKRHVVTDMRSGKSPKITVSNPTEKIVKGVEKIVSGEQIESTPEKISFFRPVVSEITPKNIPTGFAIRSSPKTSKKSSPKRAQEMTNFRKTKKTSQTTKNYAGALGNAFAKLKIAGI